MLVVHQRTAGPGTEQQPRPVGRELVALATRERVPTITTLMRRLPVVARLGIVAGFALLFADHFTIGFVP